MLRRQLRSLMQRVVLHTRKRLTGRAYRHWHTTTLFEQLVHNSASLQALHERHNSLVSHADSLSARVDGLQQNNERHARRIVEMLSLIHI